MNPQLQKPMVGNPLQGQRRSGGNLMAERQLQNELPQGGLQGLPGLGGLGSPGGPGGPVGGGMAPPTGGADIGGLMNLIFMASMIPSALGGAAKGAGVAKKLIGKAAAKFA